ncbi:ATP-binding protein [Mesorhizobium sp. M1233]|uniref:ATP-binding protein n=1 Tax=Mesorhizobium sp. M1233 TaxID=2957072 RepID=UPI0033372529
MNDAANIVFIGPNGVGKSTLARNVAHQALICGHTVLFRTASEMLGELAALDSDAALRRRLHHYAAADVLAIDEVGYLSYSNRHADLLFELISRRYEKRSTIITTNRPFADWSEVFPNAACVVSLVDRLMHRSEVISIEGDSYRFKEAAERSKAQREKRTSRSSGAKRCPRHETRSSTVRPQSWNSLPHQSRMDTRTGARCLRAPQRSRR